MNNVFEKLLEGLDLDELKELKGFSRYLVDIRNGKIYDCEKEEWKKNTPNFKGYVYHRLVKDDNTDKVMSMHRIVLLSVLEGFDYRRLNLVIDHKNNDPSDNRFENLQAITQSANLKKRKYVKPKRFTEEELDELYNDFEKLNEVIHGELMDAYERLAIKKYNCSPVTIQLKYLDYKNKKAQ